MRIASVIAIAALTLGAPVFTDNIGLTDTSAAYAKGNGNGNGGGNGKGGGNGGSKSGGKGGGNGGGKADKSAKMGGDKASRGGKGGSNPLKSLFGKKTKKTKTVRASTSKVQKQRSVATNKRAKTAHKPEKIASAQAPRKSMRPPALPEARPVNADLKGLNSLNRNINGLMNSSDPKMAGFRDFVLASVGLAAAKAALALASESYDPLAEDYASLLEPLGLEVPQTAEEFDALSEELDALATAPQPVEEDFLNPDGSVDQAAFDAALADWDESVSSATAAQTEYDAIRDAFDEVEQAQMDVAEGEESTSDAALTQAIVDGLNATGAGPVTDADVTDEMFDWVSSRMGVGEEDGLVDDYIGDQAEEAALEEEDVLIEEEAEEAALVAPVADPT